MIELGSLFFVIQGVVKYLGLISLDTLLSQKIIAVKDIKSIQRDTFH